MFLLGKKNVKIKLEFGWKIKGRGDKNLIDFIYEELLVCNIGVM